MYVIVYTLHFFNLKTSNLRVLLYRPYVVSFCYTVFIWCFIILFKIITFRPPVTFSGMNRHEEVLYSQKHVRFKHCIATSACIDVRTEQYSYIFNW